MQNKPLKILLISTFSLLVTSIYAKSSHTQLETSGNFEKPNYIAKSKLEKSETAPKQNVVQRCFVYDDLAVIETNDPGVMGAQSLVIRPITHKESEKTICNKENKDHSYEMKINGYFAGKFNKYIFTKGPDCVGQYCPFQIFYASDQNYRLILEGTTAVDKNFLFIRQPNGSMGIDYWVGLKSTCSLADKEKERCWKKVLRKGNLGWLPLPDCIGLYRQQRVSLDTPSQVLLHMEVPDLKYPTRKNVINEESECFPQP